MTEHVQRRDTADVAEATGRLIRAIGRRVAREDVEQLEHLQQLEDALKAAWEDAITGLRHNYSDMDIARQLGVTRQAVSQRWPWPERRTVSRDSRCPRGGRHTWPNQARYGTACLKCGAEPLRSGV